MPDNVPVKTMKLFLIIISLLWLAAPAWSANCGGVTVCACGDTVTSDYTLTADLDCTNDGAALTIGDNNIDIDLGGFEISGDDSTTDYAVYATGRSGTTISNGTVSDVTTAGIYSTSSTGSLVISSIIATSSFKGIYINGALTTGLIENSTIFSNSNTGINLENTQNVTINDTSAYSNTAFGILTAGTASGHIFNDITVYNNTEDGVGTTSFICNRCLSYANGHANAGLGDGFDLRTGTVIINNSKAFGNYNTGMAIDGDADVTVINSTFYDNGNLKDERNADIWIDSTGTVILKNNITKGGTQAIDLTATAVVGITFTSDYNLFDPAQVFSYDGTDARTFSQWQNDTSGDANSVNKDPLFVNAAGNNFNLTPQSPAIDAGLPISSFNTDFINTHRPQGAGWDIGAYEFIVLRVQTGPGQFLPNSIGIANFGAK